MRNFRAKLKGKLKYLGHLFYYEQVKFSFSQEVLRAAQSYPRQLPAGYKFRRFSQASVDLELWADLLNSDGHFGYWDGQRVTTDIQQQLINPDAVSLLFFGESLIGCGCACLSQTDGVGLLMWMLIAEGHRGRGLARPLLLRTLAFFARAGYRKVVATTDVFRLPALYLYLSNGAMPEYDSIYSFVQWWRIKIAMNGFMRKKQRDLQP